MPAYGSWRHPRRASEHGDGLEPTASAAAAVKHLQPCTADSHGDGLEPATRTAAAAKHLQPCTAHRGGSASVTKLATLASSEHGDGPLEPTTKAAAAAKHLQHGTAHRGEAQPVRMIPPPMRPLMLPETPISPPTRQPSTAHTPHTHAHPRPHSTHYAHAGNGPVDDKGPFTTAISAATHGGTFGVSLAPPPEHFKQTTDQLRGHLLHGGHALGDRLHAMKRGRRDKRLGGGEDDAATTRIAEKLTTIIEADDLGEGLME
eukprot:scaffold29992_cov31-Phaeocystis_antarctica.AAC.1